MRALFLLPMLLLACNKDEDSGDVATTTIPDLPTGGCDMASYDWLPIEQMGGVLDSDEADDLALGAAAIDFLLQSYGINQFSPLPYDVRAWRIRYVSQDRGQQVEATMVLTMPDDSAGSFPLVLFPHGTTGFTDACAPSAGGMEENALPIVFASMGYAVVAPDYLGMSGFGEPAGMMHPYMVPEATAVASLDAVRAALAFQEEEQPGPVMDPARTVLWGGSEGGFAAQWAELYAPQYLPEIQVAATLALVPPTDLTAIALAGLQQNIDASDGLVAAWVGQHTWYQAPGADLSQVLLDDLAQALPDEMMADCYDFPSLDSAETLEDVFQADVLAQAAKGSLEGLDPWDCYLGMADLVQDRIVREIDPPVLVVNSGADELVVAHTVRDSVPELCDRGYDIDYLECAGADHGEGAVLSLPYQFEWIAARLEGQDLGAESCVMDEPIDCEEFLDLEE